MLDGFCDGFRKHFKDSLWEEKLIFNFSIIRKLGRKIISLVWLELTLAWNGCKYKNLILTKELEVFYSKGPRSRSLIFSDPKTAQGNDRQLCEVNTNHTQTYRCQKVLGFFVCLFGFNTKIQRYHTSPSQISSFTLEPKLEKKGEERDYREGGNRGNRKVVQQIPGVHHFSSSL